ncbi:MAG: hypothetical protein SCH70_09365 [Candidatus Methanoperedens sp.]|nr:hypothetical protein [Candidatus Methanoperedens sp.]
MMITNRCSKCGVSNLESNIVFHHLSYDTIRNTGIKGRVFKELIETNVYVYTMILYNPETDKLKFKFLHTGQHKENKAENQKRYRSKEKYKSIRSECNKRYRNSEKGRKKQREADMRYKDKMEHRSSIFDF